MSSKRARQLAARRLRLAEGRCPVHGLSLGQVGGWDYRKDGRERRDYGEAGDGYTLVACPRRDCAVLATTKHFEGPAFLLPSLPFVGSA